MTEREMKKLIRKKERKKEGWKEEREGNGERDKIRNG